MVGQDPDDPDNWGIGSRNREQAMYGHLYKELKGRKRVETRNRAAVKPPGTAAHERALVRKLIEPSDFLKKQFGPGAKYGDDPERSVGALRALQRAERGRAAAPSPLGASRSAPVLAAPERALFPGRDAALAASAARQGDAARRLREGRSIAPLSDLPPLDGQPEVATGVREKLGHWKDRVASFARATEETSPRGYVYRVRAPLLERSRSAATLRSSARPAKGATKAPLPRAATEAVAAPLPRHGHRQQYGPYPYANIDRFVGAYKACVAPSQRFGAPVAARAVLDHPVVADNDYLRKRGDDVLGRAGAAGTLGLRGLLRGFFPLIKPSELSEVADGFLARNGVGPWARKAGGGERENELRAIFDLFDVDRAGAVDLRELADAVSEGSSALAGNEDWPALAGALFDHLAALERRAAPGGKARVSFDQFADIVQSAISTRD